jgi:signal transduction histidine kinase
MQRPKAQIDSNPILPWKRIVMLALALLIPQLFYWFILLPGLLKPTPPVDRLDIPSAWHAQIASPDIAELNDADFEPVDLPWRLCCEPGYHAVQATFELQDVPDEGVGIVPIVGSDNYRMLVNGSLIFGEGRMQLPDITYNGSVRGVWRIPSGVLKPGTNTVTFVMVRDEAIGRFFVAPPIVGSYGEIKSAFARREFVLNDYFTISCTVGATLLLLSTIVWLTSGRPAILFWLSILLLGWIWRVGFFDIADPTIGGTGRLVLLYWFANAVPVAWLNFANAWRTKPVRGLAAASVAVYILISGAMTGILTFNLIGDIDTVDTFSAWLALGCSVGAIGLFAEHVMRSSHGRYWEIGLFVLCLSLFAVDAYADLSGLHFGDNVNRALPFVLLALIAAFVARNVRLFLSSEQLNATLQLMLDAREAELAEAHARETWLVRRQAHEDERQRIMRDMHDGLGSQLMSLLLSAKRGIAEPAHVAEGLQSVIDEMRLMIDSMDSVGESLGAALAMFRERIHTRVEAAGIGLDWANSYEGEFPDYGPREILQIFRVLQEAVANALKHSGADRISINIAHGSQPKSLLIQVADDGAWKAESSPNGRGLANMRTRAGFVGGDLDIQGGPDGTVMTLTLPLQVRNNGANTE